MAIQNYNSSHERLSNQVQIKLDAQLRKIPVAGVFEIAPKSHVNCNVLKISFNVFILM